MTTQRQLFDPMLATSVGRQGTLFDGSAVDVPCPACGRLQVVTASNYLTCPHGCLKLRPDVPADDQATGGLFREV